MLTELDALKAALREMTLVADAATKRANAATQRQETLEALLRDAARTANESEAEKTRMERSMRLKDAAMRKLKDALRKSRKDVCSLREVLDKN